VPALPPLRMPCLPRMPPQQLAAAAVSKLGTGDHARSCRCCCRCCWQRCLLGHVNSRVSRGLQLRPCLSGHSAGRCQHTLMGDVQHAACSLHAMHALAAALQAARHQHLQSLPGEHPQKSRLTTQRRQARHISSQPERSLRMHCSEAADVQEVTGRGPCPEQGEAANGSQASAQKQHAAAAPGGAQHHCNHHPPLLCCPNCSAVTATTSHVLMRHHATSAATWRYHHSPCHPSAPVTRASSATACRRCPAR
jgi:hypothetical protein